MRSIQTITRINEDPVSGGEQVFVRELPKVVWPSDPLSEADSTYLVRGLFNQQTLIVLYGESTTGKSTLAVNLGFAIATGAPWRGRETAQGLVLHIAGEGARGLRLRQVAHCKHHNVPLTAPYGVLPTAAQFTPGEDQAIVALVAQAARDTGCAPRLVIVDTLARCMVGDENASVDMAAFITACDYVRSCTGAAVLVLHHSGKDASKGARGHSSLRAAADTELQIEGTSNPRTLHVRKQRDLELTDSMGFRLEAVTLSSDNEASPVTACVVMHDEAAVVAKPKATGRNQVTAINALREWARLNHEDVIDSMSLASLLTAHDIGRQRRPEVLNYLEGVGILTPSAGGHTLNRGLI